MGFHTGIVLQGHLEGDESPEAAALRETQEETGLDVSVVTILSEIHREVYTFASKSKGSVTKQVTFFAATVPFEGAHDYVSIKLFNQLDSMRV